MFDPDAFSDDFQLLSVQPDPEESPAEEQNSEHGPWISHGTEHVGFKPRH